MPTVPIAQRAPSIAQLAALKWLINRTGDGVFERRGTVLASGERAPVMRATWNGLRDRGLIEFYGKRSGRVRVTKGGLAVDLSKIEESRSHTGEF